MPTQSRTAPLPDGADDFGKALSPEPEPRITIGEFEAVCGTDRVTFAGFRAHLFVTEDRAPKDRTLKQWQRTLKRFLRTH